MQITITLDQATADALACYLDDEEVFPEVVDMLLKEIPFEPLHVIDFSARAIMATPHWNSWDKQSTFGAFLSFHGGLTTRDVVFRFKQTARAPLTSDGFVRYEKGNAYWFDEHPVKDGVEMGYYHPYSGHFAPTNAEMRLFLVETGVMRLDTLERRA